MLKENFEFVPNNYGQIFTKILFQNFSRVKNLYAIFYFTDWFWTSPGKPAVPFFKQIINFSVHYVFCDFVNTLCFAFLIFTSLPPEFLQNDLYWGFKIFSPLFLENTDFSPELVLTNYYQLFCLRKSSIAYISVVLLFIFRYSKFRRCNIKFRYKTVNKNRRTYKLARHLSVTCEIFHFYFYYYWLSTYFYYWECLVAVVGLLALHIFRHTAAICAAVALAHARLLDWGPACL